jgi:hypothetical protein
MGRGVFLWLFGMGLVPKWYPTELVDFPVVWIGAYARPSGPLFAVP